MKITDVLNIQTGEIWSYALEPRIALMTANLQEKGDYNMCNYPDRYPHIEGQIKVEGQKLKLGRWVCFPGVDLFTLEGKKLGEKEVIERKVRKKQMTQETRMG